MTTTNQWIPMTERRPSDGDYPIWAHLDNEAIGVTLLFEAGLTSSLAAHWQPATVPAGPVVERTQGQADDDACWDWVDSRRDPRTPSVPETWHAAIAYRDAANRDNLSRICYGEDSIQLNELRKRAGLTP